MKKVLFMGLILILALAGIWVACDKDEPVTPILQDENGFRSAKQTLVSIAESSDMNLPPMSETATYGKAGFRATKQLQIPGNVYQVEVLLGTAQPSNSADVCAISMVFECKGNISIYDFYGSTNVPYICDLTLKQAALTGLGAVMANKVGNRIYFSFFSLTPVKFFSTSMKSLFSFNVNIPGAIGSPMPTIEWEMSKPWYNEISQDGYTNLIMTWDNLTSW